MGFPSIASLLGGGKQPPVAPVNNNSNIVEATDRFSGKSKASKKQIEKWTRWANEAQQDIKAARSNIEKTWYINMCFYSGRQYVVYRSSSSAILGTAGALYVPPAPYWRSRPVINRIRPIVRHEIAKLTSQKPSAYVIPASTEDRDLFAAQAGEQIWDSVYRAHKLKAVIRRAVWWNQVCGNGFIKAYWDPNKVDKVSDQLGDFSFTHETPFHIFVPDFREEELEQQPYLIHAQLKSKDWVDTNFKGLDIRSSESRAEEILSDSWLNLTGSVNVRGQEKVLVLECWIKPGAVPDFPNGAMFTAIGDNIVQGFESWPYQHGKYPFAKLDHIPNGTFYSTSSIYDLISLQKEYNRTRGQIIEAKNKMAKPQLTAEKGSIVPSKITSEPGLVIEYETGYDPPKPLPLTPLPNYVTQELERIIMDMNDISGQHEISQGNAPPGVTAATAINYLQEQDDTKMAPTYDSVEEALEHVAFLTLSYVQEFWDTPRIVKVVGSDQSFDALSFKGSDLRGNTDIRVEAGSALPTSKAAKQAFIMDLMKMGFIAPEKGLEVMEIGGINKIYEAVQTDVRQAQRENLKMAAIVPEIMQQHVMEQQMKIQSDPTSAQIDPATGQPVMPLPVSVNTWDNHAIHIEIHNKYRKSQAFDDLDETAKAVFEEHVNQHKMGIFNDIMEQQVMAGPQMPPNTPGENSGPPSPDNSGNPPPPEGQ